jgi:hypothetical protein
LREIIPWTLLACAIVTLLLLLERRRRSRLTLLDEWAARHRLALEREVGIGSLAPLEPLTLVAPVVEVERVWHGRLTLAGLGSVSVWLASCLAGTQHRPRSVLLAVFDAPPELPQLRVLPTDDRGAPENLGFLPMPSDGLPAGYRLEAFATLPAAVSTAVAFALTTIEESGPSQSGRADWRIELRPGRLLIATAAKDPEGPDRILQLAADLVTRLARAQQQPAAEPPPRGPSLKLLPN